MKKILIILLLFSGFIAKAQTYPGYTNINSRYHWEAGVFKGLRIPAGDSAQFRSGQLPASGSLYWDTTDNNTPAGLYSYYNGSWILNGQSSSIELPDEILSGGSVTPEGGFRFSIQEAIYRIDNIIYTSDSGTAIVDSSHATLDRKDKLYFGTDGAFHILDGIPAENAAEPQLLGDQLEITVVDIEAGAIAANISTINVYFENDATITPSGTTAVGNSTLAPYAGTYHIRITTINNGDFVDIIKTSGTWDISGVDFLSLHIKNLAQILQLQNLRISLWNGASTGSQVSSEIILNYNKNNVTTYQAISIPMSAFGNITNTNIDRIRLRFTSNNANTTAGYDLDNIFFGDNMQQPGNGGTGSFRLNLPAFLSPSNLDVLTNGGTYPITTNGSSAQYIRGDGSLATFSAVTTVGAFGSQTESTNGATIVGSTIYFQPPSATAPGMPTPAMKASWDSSYYVQNLGDGLEIARAIDAATTGLRSLVFIGADTSASNDTTLIIEITGGAVGRFAYPTEDDASAGENREYNFSAGGFRFEAEAESVPFNIHIERDGTGDYITDFSMDDDEIKLQSSLIGSVAYLQLVGTNLTLHSDNGNYFIANVPDSSAVGTHYMLAWNATNNQLYKMDLPTGGGGATPDLQEVTDEGNGTTNGIIAPSFSHGTGKFQLVVASSIGQLTLSNAADIGTTLLPQAAGGGSTIYLPNTGGTDTLATLADLVGLGGGANTALSNLASVAINTSLISDADNTDDLGSAANAWKDIYGRVLHLDGATSGGVSIFSDALGNTINSTVLTGTGAIPVVYDVKTRADETLVNTTSDQDLFTNAAHNTFAIQANTTYEFEARFDLTHGSTAHTFGFGMTPTTATISSIEYNTNTWVTAVGTASNTQNSNRIKVTTVTTIYPSGANAVHTVEIKGSFTVGATGGFITPQIKFGVDPTGTILLKTGATFKIWATGNNTYTEVSPWQ